MLPAMLTREGQETITYSTADLAASQLVQAVPSLYAQHII